MSNPEPGQFRCGDCITITRHQQLVDLAVASILDRIIDYSTTATGDAREAISNAVRYVRP